MAHDCGCCHGSGHWGGWGQKHVLVRVILGLIILGSMFWLGMKVGELNSLVGGEYGYRHQSPYGYGMMPGGYGWPNQMMQGYRSTDATPPVQPLTNGSAGSPVQK